MAPGCLNLAACTDHCNVLLRQACPHCVDTPTQRTLLLPTELDLDLAPRPPVTLPPRPPPCSYLLVIFALSLLHLSFYSRHRSSQSPPLLSVLASALVRTCFAPLYSCSCHESYQALRWLTLPLPTPSIFAQLNIGWGLDSM